MMYDEVLINTVIENGITLNVYSGISLFGTNGVCYKNLKGEMHRENGPAVIYENGAKCWYQNGKQHRDDGPAIIWNDDDFGYYLNGSIISYSYEGFLEIQKDKIIYVNEKPYLKDGRMIK